METRRCDCCQQEINFDENMPCFLDSCNHTIRMKCIDFKALENEVESNYFNIEWIFYNHLIKYLVLFITSANKVRWSTVLKSSPSGLFKSITPDLPNELSEPSRNPVSYRSSPVMISLLIFSMSFFKISGFRFYKISFICFSSTFLVKVTVNTVSFAVLNISKSSVLVTLFVSEKALPLYISQFKISRDIIKFC